MEMTKLLRDKRGDQQPEHLEYLAKGGIPYRTVVLPDDAMNLILIGKLHEETEEIRAALQDKNEYADALQVLMDLAARNGVNWQDVMIARVHKLEKAGAFTQPRILVRD